MARPFPEDPQWRQLDRKLPPDAVIKALLRFGFRPSDIAEAFDAPRQSLTRIHRRIGYQAQRSYKPPFRVNSYYW